MSTTLPEAYKVVEWGGKGMTVAKPNWYFKSMVLKDVWDAVSDTSWGYFIGQ